ncbi:hypothetical protein KFL_002000175 [Klebsormidium nitens]|uniref:Uncharacterized protein n=1 Tax=Klebsormidium nitens TaxID=105231 RepID=A0A1Y1I2I7_KLENI|nr:hypothetical protein KFL_002000175 [Klebsormidium nitens]|eukprot:GAQ84683.1 hypothetical protein KFL_002000175 [Klebsormidium nitens]
MLAPVVMPVSKERRAVEDRMAPTSTLVAPLESSSTASKKSGKAQLGKPAVSMTSAKSMTSKLSVASAKSQRPLFSSSWEPNSSSAISDARFGAAPDVFGDSYAPTLTTLIALPDCGRVSGRSSSDGESVTSPLARKEPASAFGNARQIGTAVTKLEAGQGGLNSKGFRGETEMELKEETQTNGLRGKGSRKVRAGSEEGLLEKIRRREKELVEMARSVRKLQERVKNLEHENAALRREGSGSAKVEKGEGTEGLVREVANESAFTENGVNVETGFSSGSEGGFKSDCKTELTAKNGSGFETGVSSEVAAEPKGQAYPQARRVPSREEWVTARKRKDCDGK